MRLYLCLALLSTSLFACNKVTYVSPSTIPNGKIVNEKGHFFVAGIVGTKNLDAHKLCPEGISRVQSRLSFSDILLTTITAFLYSPRSYEVSCGTKKANR